MDARPVLRQVARALRLNEMEAVLIGNTAAALRGAPVTTVDVDFLFQKTLANIAKLKILARTLGATIFRPYYPVSSFYRVIREDDTLQLDFMIDAHGIRSFNSLKSRATHVDVGGEQLLVAALSDIIASKRATGRPRDHAVLETLEATLLQAGKEADPPRNPRRASQGNEIARIDLIRRLLAKPMSERTHFFRKRVGIASTCI